jgi:hypothetical protein
MVSESQIAHEPMILIPIISPPSGQSQNLNLNTQPGSNSLGHNIYVSLRPLIDELEQLWSSEALIHYVLRKHNFLMKTALMWTINDLPAFGMISGWSTHGKIACPYYMENNKAFMLTNSGKISFFYCH